MVQFHDRAMPSLYEPDFVRWSEQQASLLRRLARGENVVAALDLENLAEEIEDLGKSVRRAFDSHLEGLLMHLLKWQVQPARRGNSWLLTIKGHRLRLARLLRSPSLATDDVLATALTDAYEAALIEAQKETGLDESAFPAVCPWGIRDVLADGWLPA